jgi:hypothetical protein
LTVSRAVDSFVVMGKKGKGPRQEPKAAPPRWRGDAVEDRPGDEAERAADRAEGNAPIPADVEWEREETPDPDQQPQSVHGRAAHTDDPDEEIEEVAEEHQERRDAGEYPPRGKL